MITKRKDIWGKERNASLSNIITLNLVTAPASHKLSSKAVNLELGVELYASVQLAQ